MTPLPPAETVRALLNAYVDSDREAAERLVAPEFHFSSPYDNRLDRAAYFDICWPNNKTSEGFDIVRLVESGDTVFVTYVGHAAGGKAFRNTEVIRCAGGQAVEVEVYFGWNVPHAVPEGEHRDPG